MEFKMKEWIVGRNPVAEVLSAKRRDVFRLNLANGVEVKGRLAEILKMAAASKVPVTRVDRRQLDALDDSNQGVALEVSGYPYSDLVSIFDLAVERAEPLFVLVLDMIQNPQNLGTLIRTAEAVGVQGVLLPLRRTAEITPAVVHASSGATEHLLVAQANLAQALDTIKKAGAWVVGLENGPDSQPVEKVRLDGPLAVVVGNEGEGMRLLSRQSCDFLLELPMQGKIESLNAAVAGSVVLYLALQARRQKLAASTMPKP
jgi:23S rRNA (guanosine2251-2'-O)-methyltransferase